MSNLILSINPGSTSTKLGLFDGDEVIVTENINHKIEEIEAHENILDQDRLRLEYILDFLKKNQIEIQMLKAVVGRGGLLKPIPGGTYLVNENMIKDIKKNKTEVHASNLGAILARQLAEKAGCPAFIVDPVIVDELAPLARYSGMPGLERRSVFHALNQKAVAKKYASQSGKSYDELSLIVAHLGGGISVGLHHKGRVIDVNNALGGEGPFSPNRAGGLPSFDLVELCYSGKYSFAEIHERLLKKGGLAGYLGTNDLREVIKMTDKGNEEAAEVLKAMIYQIAKEIGSLAPVLEGKIDAIIITGGIAYSELVVKSLEKMVSFIGPVVIYPGEEELAALAAGAYRVITGEEKASIYN